MYDNHIVSSSSLVILYLYINLYKLSVCCTPKFTKYVHPSSFLSMYISYFYYRMSSRNVYSKAARESARVLNNLNQTPCCSYSSSLSHTCTDRPRGVDSASSDFSSDSACMSLGFNPENVGGQTINKNFLDDSDIDYEESEIPENKNYAYTFSDPAEERRIPSNNATGSLADDILMFFLIFHPNREAMEFLLNVFRKHGIEAPSSVYKLRKTAKNTSPQMPSLQKVVQTGKVAFTSIKENLKLRSCPEQTNTVAR